MVQGVRGKKLLGLDLSEPSQFTPFTDINKLMYKNRSFQENPNIRQQPQGVGFFLVNITD